MKKNIAKLFILFFVLILVLSFLGCSKLKKSERIASFQKLLKGYLDKEVAISVWNLEKSRAITSSYIVAEVNVDYIVVKEKIEGEILESDKKEPGVASVAIPFHNITSILLNSTPPTITLNDQILLTGFGETIDSLGYVGSRIERLDRSKPKTE